MHGFLASFSDSLFEAGQLVFILFGPFAIFTFLIHWFEKLIQRALAERFGWRSILWTGWLGTPIHELSHVVACVLFSHRIDQVAFFEPDRKAGRLGFVRHSWRKGNWFEEFGNLPIGIAPLIGGSVVLCSLLWLFYPDHFMTLINGAPSSDTASGSESNAGLVTWQKFNPMTTKFWFFAYLVLCVGSHMAPSPSDYRGAGKATLMFILGTIVVLGALIATGIEFTALIGTTSQLMRPLISLLVVVTLLCFLATLIVLTITRFFPRRYQLG